MKILTIRLLLGFIFCAELALADPVSVEGGSVQGAVEDGLTVYRGIPFAAPPVGDLRWKPPQPVKPWAGVLQANQFAKACFQSSAAIPMLDLPAIEVSGGETAGDGVDPRRRLFRRRDPV
jgi:para-nitrobenzyl esterase